MSPEPAAYRPLAPFAAAARPKHELWRTAAGFILIIVLYLAWTVFFFDVLSERYGRMIAYAIQDAMARAATPGATILLLFSFFGLAAAPILVTRALHGRRAGSLFGHFGTAIADFTPVVVATLSINLLLLPLMLADETVQRGIGWPDFVTFLVPALVGLLIQTSAEELVFRGYLQQQLAARFRSPLVWMALPSALFALAHYLPESYGPNALLICIWAALFGCLAADLTARTGSLGAAIGFHFANNVAAFLLVGVRGDMDGLALWTMPLDMSDPHKVWPLMIVNIVQLLVAWLAARVALKV